MDDQNNKLGDRERVDYFHPKPFWKRYLWQIIIAVLAALLLFSLLTQHLPPKTAAVVCQSSSTDNWSGWSLGGGWKLLGSMLLNDGSNGGYNGRPTLVAPRSCQQKPWTTLWKQRFRWYNSVINTRVLASMCEGFHLHLM